MQNKYKILFSLLGLSLLLRIATAIITDYYQIFPDYYFRDTRVYENKAWEMASEWRELRPAYVKGPYHYINYARMLAPVYVIFGRHDILLKLFNVIVSSIAIFLLFLITKNLFGFNTGLIMLSLITLWPSNIFWSSQILRESFVWLGLFVAIYGSLKYYDFYSIKYVLLFSTGLLIIGLLRIYNLIPILSLFPFYVYKAIKNDGKKFTKRLQMLIPVLAITSVILLYITHESSRIPGPVEILNSETDSIISPDNEIKIRWSPKQNSNYVKYRILLREIDNKKQRIIAEVSGADNSFTISPIHEDFGETPFRIIVQGKEKYNEQFIKVANSELFFIANLKDINIDKIKQNLKEKKFTERFSEKRKAIIEETVKERPPSTILFPEKEFHSYNDIIKFIPKSAFYVLFMPLPGLYPLDNIGKLFASVENSFLLFLTIIAIVGIFIAQKNVRHYLLLISLMLFIVIHSFTDVDLGCAMRHKATYFPLILIYSSFIIAKYLDKKTCQKAQGK